MTKKLPQMIGEKLPVITYIEPNDFMKIEDLRGDVPRSKFIEKMIKKGIGAC